MSSEPTTASDLTAENSSPAVSDDETRLNAGRAEYARLQVKRRESNDKDVRAALDMRIKQLTDEFGPAIEVKATKATSVPLRIKLPEKKSPPTEDERREAEALLARSRLELTRNNPKQAQDLLMQAVELAPGSPSVLEALGDHLLEKRQFPEAKVAFERAKELDPRSASIERKFGTAVLQEFNAGTIDEQLRLGLSDNLLLNSEDRRAGGLAATVLSCFLPGLGHIVLGRTTTGIAIVISWIVCGIWFLFNYKDFAALLNFAKGGAPGSPNMVVLIPLFLMIVIFVGTLKSLATPKESAQRGPVERPRPPVDLPFE